MILRIAQKAMFPGAALLMGGGVVMVGTSPADASFPGGNGDLVWSAICQAATGQQIWGAPSTATNLQCPSGSTTASASSTTYQPVTAGPTDSMPYFSSDGKSVVFSSTRTNGSSNNHNAIWWVPYSNTVTGSTAPFTDGAQELTTPGSDYDYAPTLSVLTDGVQTLAWIRCVDGARSNSAASNCSLWIEQLTNDLPSSTPLQLGSVTGTVAGPGSTSGDSNRPEIDPANPNWILYTDTDSQIHLASISGTPLFGGSSADVNLSAESECPACTPTTPEGTTDYGDSSPDWSPDGSAIVFSSDRTANYSGATNNQDGGDIPFTMTSLSSANPTVLPVWSGIPAAYAGDSFIEPVYAPDTGTGPGQTPDYNVNPNQDVNPSNPKGTPPTLAWIHEAQSTNVGTLDDGNVGSNNMVAATTANQTNNLDVDWQPTATVPAQTPESPLTVALPLAGGAILVAGGLLIGRRGRRQSPIRD